VHLFVLIISENIRFLFKRVKMTNRLSSFRAKRSEFILRIIQKQHTIKLFGQMQDILVSHTLTSVFQKHFRLSIQISRLTVTTTRYISRSVFHKEENFQLSFNKACNSFTSEI
jgi:hypothetical protein